MHIKDSKYIFHKMATQIAWSSVCICTLQAGMPVEAASASVVEDALKCLGNVHKHVDAGKQNRISSQCLWMTWLELCKAGL